MSHPEPTADPTADRPHHYDRRALALFLVPMAALIVVERVADAFSPTLLIDAPWLLMILSPRSRLLVLVAGEGDVPVVWFFVLAIFRQMIGDPIFYFFGRRYGEVAIRWMEKRTSTRTVRFLETWYRRASYVLVALVPNSVVCLLAGATRMPVPAFLAVNFLGTVAKVTAIWFVGDIFSDLIRDVIDWVTPYRWWLTAVAVVLVAFVSWRQWRRGELGIESVEEFEEELEEAEEELREEAHREQELERGLRPESDSSPPAHPG